MQIGLGIEQELSRDDDTVTDVESIEDRQVIAVLRADNHRTRCETSFAKREHHVILRGTTNHRVARDCERRLAALASGGNATAMRLYGLRLAEGRDYPRDLPLAVSWLRRAAEAGDRLARPFVGLLMSDPKTPGADPVEALR